MSLNKKDQSKQIMKVRSHNLVNNPTDPILWVPSKSFSNVTIDPKFLIIHFTAGRSFHKSLHTLTQGLTSCHVLIGREGQAAQLVKFNKKAWHAGSSKWKGIQSLNRVSHGIELDNAGKLEKIGPNKWKTWFNEIIEDESQVYTHTDGTHWHAFTHAQLEKLWDIGAVLNNEYEYQEILGHSDISQGRKVDPGPALDMEAFREHLKRTKKAKQDPAPTTNNYWSHDDDDLDGM